MPVGFNCDVAEDCWSGLCAENGLCTRPCSDEVLCPDGYDCKEGVCELFPVGFPCEIAEDCFSGICGNGGFCTRQCSDVAPCPEDLVCSENGLCEEAGVGDLVCVEGSDCPAGWCLNNYCTRPCGADIPCPEGTECSEELGLCEAPVAVLEEEGVLEEMASNDLGQPQFFETGFEDGETLGSGCSAGSNGQAGLVVIILALFSGLATFSRLRRRRAHVRVAASRKRVR